MKKNILAVAAALALAGRNAVYEQINVRELNRTDGFEPFKMGTVDIGNVAYTALGTSAVHVAGTIYMCEGFLPRSKLVTGIGVLNGTIVGTDNLIVALYDGLGNLLANSALAGVLSAGANAFQEINFTIPYKLKNDGIYYFATQSNGVTCTTRRVAASTYLRRTKSVAGVFGTLPANIAPPTTFTADVGPISYVF